MNWGDLTWTSWLVGAIGGIGLTAFTLSRALRAAKKENN